MNELSFGAYVTPKVVPKSDRRSVSIIAPCYNEDETVDVFYEAITAVMADCDVEYRLMFINDGSSDHTLEKLKALCARDDRVDVIALSRNFGKEAALTAGLDYAVGDGVIVIDVDLQDPPELIAQFIEKWRDGFDVVYAARANRESDTFAKRSTAGGFYRFFNRISSLKIPENAGDYRLMDRCVVETIKTLPERSRFMKGLFAWAGYRAVGIPYTRPERVAGETSFNFWRLWNFALDGITSFSTVPLRIWTYFGAVVAFFSLLYSVYIVMRTIFFGVDIPGYASLIVSILFFGSVQMISVGVLGEYIARLFVEVKRRPVYVVDELIDENTDRQKPE